MESNYRFAPVKDNPDGSLVIGFYPYPETIEHGRDVFAQQYKALSFTFGISYQIILHPEEAVPLGSRSVIAIEEGADMELKDFIHPEGAVVYIVGNSAYRHPSKKFKVDQTLRVAVPNIEHPLYGYQATAIVLYDRYMKNANI